MSRFNESFSVPVGIKGTFWALIDFSLFAIGPNLHCSRIFCPLHWFLFLWLAIIDHTLHIWSTLLFHFWIRTDWNFLEVINGIIPLFYYMITLWPILVYNLINRVNSVKMSLWVHVKYSASQIWWHPFWPKIVWKLSLPFPCVGVSWAVPRNEGVQFTFREDPVRMGVIIFETHCIWISKNALEFVWNKTRSVGGF